MPIYCSLFCMQGRSDAVLRHVPIYIANITILVELLAIRFHDTVSQLWPVGASNRLPPHITQAGATGLAFINDNSRCRCSRTRGILTRRIVDRGWEISGTQGPRSACTEAAMSRVNRCLAESAI